MQFCPKCGAILVPKKEGSKKFISCSCGYKTTEFEEAKVSEKVKKTEKEVEVIEEEKEIHPITEAECPKCQNNQAYFWEIQTRASDEPATKFLKCTKCKHIWRDYL